MPQTFQIAIDGPVAVGKSTAARIIAQRLGFTYIDTGAMYRATGLLAVRNNVDANDQDAVAKLLESHTIKLEPPQGEKEDGRKITVYLDGEDVSWIIRTEEVSNAASKVAQHPKVREKLVEQQQALAQSQNVVMEGRDITFRVLPNAQLKIFLHANSEQRGQWRLTELLESGQDVTLEQVLEDLKERDYRDMHREVDPLHVAEDAWNFDRSAYTLEETIDIIEKRARELMAESK